MCRVSREILAFSAKDAERSLSERPNLVGMAVFLGVSTSVSDLVLTCLEDIMSIL